MNTKLVLKTDMYGRLRDNIILSSDAYKMTHWTIYPEGTETVYSYLESRGGKYPGTLFYGLQIYLIKYIQGTVIEQWMIEEADTFCSKVFGNDKLFNREGWQYIVDVHGGRLPVRIKAVPEGTLIPNHNVMFTIENTDSRVPWITNFLETILFEPMWYGSTVSTTSFYIKKLIEAHAILTGEHVNPFHLHDFGFRGVSSKESAGVGGSAHLVNFLGTDTLEGIRYAMHYYNADVCGYSVVASEHSVVTMYGLGKENEIAAYTRMMDQHPTGIFSSVSDTYDYEFTIEEIYGKKLREKILSREGKWVVRPDSGHPPTVTVYTLNELWKAFGGTINEKGFKVINPKIGIIYGDGINYDMINNILHDVVNAGFAISNVIFGCGGALLQAVNRDTQRMAIKASYGVVNGIGREIQKTTKNDLSKASKRGRLRLVNSNDKYMTYPYPIIDPDTKEEIPMDKDVLETVFENGVITKRYTFDEVRGNAEESFKRNYN